MLQALADPDVAEGMGLFVGNVTWDRGDTGHQPDDLRHRSGQPAFVAPEIAADLALLQVQDAAILDRLARGLPRDEAAAIRPQTPLSFETQGRTLTALTPLRAAAGSAATATCWCRTRPSCRCFPRAVRPRPTTSCCACAPAPMRGGGRRLHA
jgi:hypothetical protein